MTFLILGFASLAVVLLGVMMYVYLQGQEAKADPDDPFAESEGVMSRLWRSSLRSAEIKLDRSMPMLAPLLQLDQFFILLITLGLALVGAPVYASILYGSPGPIIILIMVFPMSIPMFPLGLAAMIQHNYEASVASGLSPLTAWVPYLLVFLAGTFIKSRVTFILVYIIFITLLLMNIEGCARLLPAYTSGYN
jgi:uncharacterized MAPEG superfamily protein